MHFVIRESSVLMVFILGMLPLGSADVFAQTLYPSCTPMESAWDNIELMTELDTHEGEITLTVSMLESPLQYHYGFAFMNNDRRVLPVVKERTQFHQYFGHTTLLALQEKPENKEGDRLYWFKPVEQGHWVIYLIASSNRIDFLERRQLQVQPNIDSVRGGTLMTGSSFNLEDSVMVDYKVCQIP